MSGSQTQTINFGEIPSPWQVPGSHLEVKADYQNVGILPIPARALIIGQKITAGSAALLAIIPNVTRALDGRGYGGPGSQIDAMVESHLAVNRTVPLDIVCVADAVGAAAAVWTYTFAGTATQGGTPAVNIEGQRVTIGTIAGDAAAIAATEWAASIAAIPKLPVAATVTGAVVTVTAKNAGLCGNDISHVPNPAIGDSMPPGLTLTIAQTVQGTTNPDISAALAAITGLWYTDIIMPWQDATNIGELSAELERRFNAMVHQDGRGHGGTTGSFSQQLSKASTANARFIYGSPLVAPGSAPWRIAAAAGGICADRLTADPSRQLDQLAMPGIIGPQRSNLPDDYEKELLLVGGCSVFHVQRDSTMLMQRYVSNYTMNAAGNLDPAWHDVMEQAVASRIRYDWKAYFRMLYPSNKLALDGTMAAEADPTVCTPNRAKASWASRMLAYARAGWVVDEINQARAAVFIIDPNDGNRLNYRLPYKRIGNLMVDAGQLLFAV